MKQLKKTILTLVALLAVKTGAWATDETLLTTITPTGDGTYSETTAGAVTVTPAGSFFYSGSYYGWVWDYYGSLTVTANEGYTIARCVFIQQGNNQSVTISKAPFALNFEERLCLENYSMDGVTSIEVYGYAPAASSSGPTVTFTASDLADGSSITKDGVTLTSYGQYGINMNGVNGPGEFTNSLGGNFTKIVVTADGLPSGDGWSAGTWTGSASSVSFTGNIDTWGNEFSIVCTLETAPSGPEVAWDKAEKTGSFTMPGGNVTLQPEYYPQAELTAEPTAIHDVPATTDGAIVNAGTVANIGETTTAQGTVMYYVSQTALDDAALLALAADQWTADVPTAESLAEGQAYVYYYVRGNDGDTDETTFSDGDIVKAANALTVTIAAAPTYAVTFADDLSEPTLWTADPAADVKKGETVTVT